MRKLALSKKSLAVLTTGLMSASLAHASMIYSGSNLIVNGSFEGLPGSYIQAHGSAIAGWTVTRTGVEWLNPSIYGGLNSGAAAAGHDIVDLAYLASSNGGIMQTISTEIGRSYELTFEATNWGSFLPGVDSSTIGLNIAGLFVGNSSTATSPSTTTHHPLAPWETFTFDFTATGTTTSLEFFCTQDARTVNAFLDNVIVQAGTDVPDADAAAVPEPGTWVLFCMGLMGCLIASKRKSPRHLP